MDVNKLRIQTGEDLPDTATRDFGPLLFIKVGDAAFVTESEITMFRKTHGSGVQAEIGLIHPQQ